MIKQLRIKFVCINMMIVLVMLCIIFGLVYHFTQENLEAESISMMQTIATNPFRLGTPNEKPDEVRLPYFTLQLGIRGELIATGGGYYDLSDEEFLGELIDVSFNSAEPTGVLEEYKLRYCRVTNHGTQCLVFADISSELATLEALTRTCIIIGILSFLLFLGISLLLARWAVKPVDLAWKQQKQFVADASHELKTPLTVIMTNAEMLNSTDFAEEERSRFSESILTMSQQMRGLVERLLELARVDNGQLKTSFEPLDMSQLVSDIILPFEPVFFEKGLQLSSCIDSGIMVSGSKEHLKQVVDILLDNAQKYSFSQGLVDIRLLRHGRNHCILSVSNQGESISQEDLKNIFKRFYRLDKARSRTGSYGLGLSIAEQIVFEHKGKIWAQSNNGVNTFFVLLPIE